MLEPEKLLGKVQFDAETGRYVCQILHLSDIEYIQAASIDELREQIAASMAENTAELNVVEDYQTHLEVDNLLLLEPS